MSLDPARAAVRLAVRRRLTILNDGEGGQWAPDLGDAVVVACSGGADSLALLAATIFEVHKVSAGVIGVVVDHGLQDGSAEHTARVVQQMAALGVDETATVRVTVDPGPAGIEAGAREARYAALSQLAATFGPRTPVLLGHTRDDQAETVLLGLARGSGGRSLQGMRRSFQVEDASSSPLFLRPLLGITRAQTEAACRADGISWWEDPHNTDPRFTRARIRHTVLPLLERELGPGVAAALARTADSIRDDVAALDAMAEDELQGLTRDGGLDARDLETYEHALKTRIIRLATVRAGAIASELTRDHILAVVDIAYGARERREIQLPGHVTAYRDGDLLRFRPTVTDPGPPPPGR